jgi:prepilin-type N-terminal cleavage/methylation domain-containing protein
MTEMKRASRGFTLAEVAIAAALMAILAAATVPSFVEYLAQRDVESTAKTLASIASGIVSYETTVKMNGGTTNTYPRKISYLTNQIATTDTNSCGVRYSVAGTTTTLLSTYSAAAPFVSFYIPPGGLNTPVGTISDNVVRNPNSATVGTISIVMSSIDSADAVRLERYIDGTDGNIAANRTSGIFRITATAFPKMDVSYIVPAAAKC